MILNVSITKIQGCGTGKYSASRSWPYTFSLKRNFAKFNEILRIFRIISTSVSDLDRHGIRILLTSWIRILIRIRNEDPDPGGIKLSKTKGKNVAKRQKIHN
jgi:hypothetical protein